MDSSTTVPPLDSALGRNSGNNLLPAAVSDAREGVSRSSATHRAQKWAALIGGGTLALLGARRRTGAGLALAAAGGALAYAGATAGHAVRHLVGFASVCVNCSTPEAYRMWRNFEQLPLFMRHLESVAPLGNGRYRWIAFGPMGVRAQWEAEIVTERENQFLAWRSVPNSQIAVSGAVEFRGAPANRGTIIAVNASYRLPTGALGRSMLKLLGKEPGFLMQQDLRRFKALIETGEIPTTEGQPHGPRSLLVAAARVADPDQPVRRVSEIGGVLKSKRGIA